jgi:hypothetical protein
VAINDVIAHVPDCVYGFANDGVAKWKDAYRKGQILFQPSRCMHEYDSTQPGALACDVVTYEDESDDRRLAESVERLAKSLCIRRGTLGSALQILHIMGVRSVHMVGIDGGGKHAEGIEWKTRLRHDHARDYNAIRSAAIDSAFIMGIALKFHNHDHTMETNGRVYVRFLKNALAQEQHYASGEIASFSPKIANELIGCRAAEPYAAPVKVPVQIETTESKVVQAAESAVIKTTKGKTRK